MEKRRSWRKHRLGEINDIGKSFVAMCAINNITIEELELQIARHVFDLSINHFVVVIAFISNSKRVYSVFESRVGVFIDKEHNSPLCQMHACINHFG